MRLLSSAAAVAVLALTTPAFAAGQAAGHLADDLADRFRWPPEKFQAHMTLAQTIRPAWLRDEILAFAREAEPIGPRRFARP